MTSALKFAVSLSFMGAPLRVASGAFNIVSIYPTSIFSFFQEKMEPVSGSIKSRSGSQRSRTTGEWPHADMKSRRSVAVMAVVA